jgi:predicted metal-binding protein
MMKKVGIIRCRQTEDMCPGSNCFKTAREGGGAFEEIKPVEVVGFVSCGGCPGKRAVHRAKQLVERGADAIALASCITKGTPIGFPCPFAKKMKEAIEGKIGETVRVLEYSH